MGGEGLLLGLGGTLSFKHVLRAEPSLAPSSLMLWVLWANTKNCPHSACPRGLATQMSPGHAAIAVSVLMSGKLTSIFMSHELLGHFAD